MKTASERFDEARARAAARYRDGTVAWSQELRDRCIAEIDAAYQAGFKEGTENACRLLAEKHD